MFNLNILLGLLYALLAVCELLVVKHLIAARLRQLRAAVAKHERKAAANSNPDSNKASGRRQLTAGEVLHHFLIRHPFSKCCQRHFPHRSYELLIVWVVVALMASGNTLNQLIVVVPTIAAADCLLIGLSVWLKLKCSQRLQNRVQEQLKAAIETMFPLEDSMLRRQPSEMRLIRQLNFGMFEYETGYAVLSAISLALLGIKFYQLGYAPIIASIELELTGLAACCSLLLVRPVNLFVLGLIASVILKAGSSDFAEKHPNLYEAVAADYEHEYLLSQKEELLATDTGQANRRINSELRIEDLRQEEHTEEQMNTHSNGLIEEISQPPNELHSRKPSDMGLMMSMVHPPSQAQQEEKYDEEERISPVKVSSAMTVKFNSQTIKKDQGLRTHEVESCDIRQIEEFRIVENDDVDNYRTKKPQETAPCTSTETASGKLAVVRKDASAPLHEININTLEDRIATKPLYGENKRQSDRVLGTIIDGYDEIPTENLYEIEGGKPRRKSRLKRIHIVYTQESSEFDQQSRSQSMDTHSQHISRDDASRQEKENVPESSLANMKPPLKRSINGSIHLPPIRPADLMIIRNHPDNENAEPTEESCDRKRKRRRASKRPQDREEQVKERSPYLEFLPRMLKKEESERNHSCVIDSRKHSDRKKRPQQCPSKQGLQLQIIKKTISSEIDTVYT